MSDYKDAAAKLHGLLNGAAESAERAMAPAKPVQATVYRVVDGKAYVKTDGDDTEKGPFEMSVEATAGNRVALTNLGGTWAVTDNLTSPCTDDSRANAAWDYADSAKTAADQAGTAASNAATAAANAQTSANNAATAASNAATAASNAQTSANNAATAAATADGKAVQAKNAADAAATAASVADGKAVAAGNSAQQANTYALGALTGLSTVQDVIGVLNWAAENAEFALTSDTSIVPGKVYWTRSGTAPDYTYTPIANPVESGLPNYYEVDDVDDAMGDYISAHLALTDSGLYVMQDSSGYRLRITSSGWYIIDPQGIVVNQSTANGSDIGATTGRHIHIGTSSIDLMNGNDVDMAHFGYGQGAGPSGTATAPYYTLGSREATAPVGNYSMAEGVGVQARGYASHAEGAGSAAVAIESHAEGNGTLASGSISHAEGDTTTASGVTSHAEGYHTTASGNYSHSEGQNAAAFGQASHSEGVGTDSRANGGHAQGRWNKRDTNGTYAHIVGNGTANDARSDAHTLDWSGNAWFAGGVDADGDITTDGDVSAGGDITATGAVSGASISDGTGTLAQLRESVNQITYPSATRGQAIPLFKMTLSNPVVCLPCPMKPASVSVSNAEVLLDNGTWSALTYVSWSWTNYGNWLVITFTGPSLTSGNVYWMRMTLTVA